MADPEHVEVVKSGTRAIARWRQEHPKETLDLSGADLSRANLSEADLSGADLSDANLSGAYLTGAYLILTDLSWANLSSADLTSAILVLAKLRRASLAGTNFESANFGATLAADCNLAQCVGLGAVKHAAPSSIGVDTLVASFRGAGTRLTPELETFFLGAGVPKELLAALPQILAEVPYCTSFVCYGEPDKTFAERLVGDLKARGVSCWLYSMDATPGEPIWREIGRKRRELEKMVVLCSIGGLMRPGARKEIEEQIDEETDKIVPVSLDNLWKEPGFAVVGSQRDLKPFLLGRTYADFSDESAYEASLDRLLQGLRRKDAQAS
jgi:uncharacterized protein YjbI with pentapeptide repeats